MHLAVTTAAAITACGLVGCGGGPATGSDAPETTAAGATSADDALDPKVLAVVRCYEPQVNSYGFQPGRCAKLEKSNRLDATTWRLRFRRGEIVYCADLRLDQNSGGDLNVEVKDIGTLEEAKCPDEAYVSLPPAELDVAFTGGLGEPGRALLSADDATHTKVVVDVDADRAWIRPGTCDHSGDRPSAPVDERLELEPFYSFRSITTVPVSIEVLTGKPWAIEWDRGGGHGGVPSACADVRE